MDQSGQSGRPEQTEAAEAALRLAHTAVAVTERQRMPEIDPAEWRGGAAVAAGSALAELSRQLSTCRSLAEQYLATARRAVGGG